MAFWPLAYFRQAATGGSRAWRIAALEHTREIIAAYRDVPFLRLRAGALITLFDHVRQDRRLRRRHERDAATAIDTLWSELAGPDYRALLPELGGPVAELAWAMQGLEAAHTRLTDAARGSTSTGWSRRSR